MLKLKWFKWYTIIPIVIVLVFGFILWLSPCVELSKIKTNQIENIGFAGENKGEVFFVFPEKQRQEFIEMLNEAKINMYPTHVGEHKGGGPVFITRILFSDKSYIDFSYVRLKNKSCLCINGKWYGCDENTIERFRFINYDCQSHNLENGKK